MKPDIFAPRALSPRDQFEAWREWYSSVFEVIPTDPISDGFPGEIRLWNLGGLAISRTIAGSSQISPTKRHVSDLPLPSPSNDRSWSQSRREYGGCRRNCSGVILRALTVPASV